MAKSANVRCVVCNDSVTVPIAHIVLDHEEHVYRTRCPQGHLVERELNKESYKVLRENGVRTITELMDEWRAMLNRDDREILQSFGVGA